MSNTALVDSLGLSMTTLFPSMGKTAEENFEKILGIFEKKVATNAATLADIADGFKLWCITCQLPSKPVLLKTHAERLFNATGALAQAKDSSSSPYKGDVYVASILAEALDNAAKMDPSQETLAAFAPFAFNAAEKVLANKSLTFQVKTPMNSEDTIDTRRAETVMSLISVLPFTKEANIPNAIAVICTVLKGSYPEQMKAKARSALQPMTMINRDGVANAGADIVDLIKLGGNDQLTSVFASVPAVYFNNPQPVHDNLTLFMNPSNFVMNASLFNHIASRHPEVLVSHVDFFVQQLTGSPVAPMMLSILDQIAGKNPQAVYPHKATILSKGKSIQSGEYLVCKILGKLALVPKKGVADECFEDILRLLDESKDQNAKTGVFAEVTNVMVLVSSRDLVLKNLPRIAQHQAASAVLYKEIDDYAHGRSLKEVTLRLDVLDAKINALNTKVTETCTNMADVIAYVDANMADMKDFLAQVVKRLPQPKRLEVVGTLRKTLILHFECARTGLEYPITSHEWSKWLKMGFSLVKAGQAVIDLGMGNPLGILKKGVECVQEIYEAYKTNDDDEFNTYITNPFLLSTEQDQLLEKLRDQKFFEIFAYDAQLGGWYLLNPEKDGRKPEGEAGSVSKVWTKKGYGITEGLVSLAEDATGVKLKDFDLELPSSDGHKGGAVEMGAVSTSSSAAAASSAGSAGGYNPGDRAAALREKFGPAANSAADAQLQDTNRTVMYQKKVDDLEAKVTELQKQYASLSTALEEVRNRPAGGCRCTIS